MNDILRPYTIFQLSPEEIQDWNCGIYIIYCIPTGKYYLGSSSNFVWRWKDHKNLLVNNRHYSKHLQRSWNKYGEDNFQFLKIEICKKENLDIREQWWLDITHCWKSSVGFNGRPTANNNSGYIWSDEQRANLSRAKIGFNHTEETKAKMRVKKPAMSERMKNNQYNKGRVYIGEERQRVSQQARKFDKWPHYGGIKCKCEECRIKKRKIENDRRALTRNKKNA